MHHGLLRLQGWRWCPCLVPAVCALNTARAPCREARAPPALAKPLPGNTRGWKRSSCPRASGLEGSGCSSECGSGRRERAACKPQPQQDGGKRTGIPGWQAGGQGGRQHNNSGGGVWRRRVVRVCEETPAAPPAPAPPATSAQPRSSSCPRSCPCWAPAARGAAAPARGTQQPLWGHG